MAKNSLTDQHVKGIELLKGLLKVYPGRELGDEPALRR